jgi:hypothetical protein
MLSNRCVSVTDLRTKTKQCLDDLDTEPKYIFTNNRPIAVLVDVNQYEEYFLRPSLIELKANQVNTKLRAGAKLARRSKPKDLVNI